MDARALVSRVAVVVCAAVVVCVLCGASALAVVMHPFVRSFGSFAGVQSVAVDQASGDVYVYDTGAGVVYRFNAEGSPVAFSSLGSNAIEGVGGSPSEAQIAVDSSSGPAKGDIYVANGGVVAIYGSDGSSLGAIGEEAPAPWGEPCGVAVDPSGSVYVGLFSGFVNKYEPKANPVTNGDYVSSVEGLSGPCNVAVDSAGNVFADTWSSGPVTRFPGGSIVDLAGSTLAVDPVSDDVYVDEGGQVSEFGAHGEPFEAPVSTFASSGAGAIAGSFGIAVNGSSGNVYVSDGNGHVSEFGTLSNLSPPIVEREWSSTVGVSTATLDASVNPVDQDTTYHFEYDTSPYTSPASHGTNAPAPDADMGSAPGSVSTALTGLQAGTPYHYRIAATNANGTTYGPEHTITTYLTPTIPSSDSCPNASFRSEGLSAGLPDCRAYEMVSPLDKNASDIEGQGATTVASVSGDRVSFAARTGFADTRGSGIVGMTQYVASRSADGWSTHGAMPTPALNSWQVFSGPTVLAAFSDELDSAVVGGLGLPGAANEGNRNNIYREDLATNALETVTVPSGSEEPGLGFSYISSSVARSSDAGVVVFETSSDMVPETDGLPNENRLYAWDHGTLRLAGILPNGTIPAGRSESVRTRSTETPDSLWHNDTMSRDGSRIMFYATSEGGSERELYMRKDATSTVLVSQSEASTPNPEPHKVTFETASPDLKHVLFASTDRLTDNDPGGPGYGLYLYTDSPNPETESNLTFIARANTAGEAPSTIVKGMSEDGSHIYFSSFETPELHNEVGTYLWDRGTVHFVASGYLVAQGGSLDSEAVSVESEQRVSADGRVFAFTLNHDLGVGDAGSDPNNPGFPFTFNALYVYGESGETLRCVSCPSSSVAMTGNVEIYPHATHKNFTITVGLRSRFLSDDGRYVFFSSPDALVPQDTNGLYDAYEYDTETGKVSLLSPGTGGNGSWFTEASASGSDVFILTRESLSGWDTDTLVDLYDARVNGGLPGPPVPPLGCLGDACQGVPSAIPTFNTASGFTGLGNQPARSTVNAKNRGKPKPKKKHKKRSVKKRGSRTSKKASHSVKHTALRARGQRGAL
jgi:hypothetical protein